MIGIELIDFAFECVGRGGVVAEPPVGAHVEGVAEFSYFMYAGVGPIAFEPGEAVAADTGELAELGLGVAVARPCPGQAFSGHGVSRA